MDRLEQIKNDVIQEDGNYRDWESYINDEPYGASDSVVNEVARRYAKAVAEDALKRAADNFKLHIVEVDRYGDESVVSEWDSHGYTLEDGNVVTVDKQSILSTPIELL